MDCIVHGVVKSRTDRANDFHSLSFLDKSSAPCAVSGVTQSAAWTGGGWVGTWIQEGLVSSRVPSHSIWCLVLQYSVHMLSLFCIPAKPYMTTRSQERADRLPKTLVWNWHGASAATFSWSKQETRLEQSQREKKWTLGRQFLTLCNSSQSVWFNEWNACGGESDCRWRRILARGREFPGSPVVTHWW